MRATNDSPPYEEFPPYENSPPYEDLPQYESSITSYDIVFWNEEYKRRASTNYLNKVCFCLAELNSTQLRLYQLQNIKISSLIHIFDLFTNLGDDLKLFKPPNKDKGDEFCVTRFLLGDFSIFDSPALLEKYKGKLLASFTLQHGHIGSASSDSHSRLYTLRLRVELEQFLLTFLSYPRYFQFYRNFKLMKEQALSIEERDWDFYSMLKTDQFVDTSTIVTIDENRNIAYSSAVRSLSNDKSWKGYFLVAWDCRDFDKSKPEKTYTFKQLTKICKKAKKADSSMIHYKRFVSIGDDKFLEAPNIEL